MPAGNPAHEKAGASRPRKQPAPAVYQARDGAQVASLRCPILRSSKAEYITAETFGQPWRQTSLQSAINLEHPPQGQARKKLASRQDGTAAFTLNG